MKNIIILLLICLLLMGGVSAIPNQFNHSEMFDQGWILSSVAISPDSLTSPTGILTADNVNASGVSTAHAVYQNGKNVTIGLPYTVSFYYQKTGSNPRIQITFSQTQFGTAFVNYYVDPTNPAVVNQSGAVGNITVDSNGWVRASATATASASGSTGYAGSWLIIANNSPRFTAFTDNTSSMGMWGAQFEQNSSVSAYNATDSSVPPGAIPLSITNLINSTPTSSNVNFQWIYSDPTTTKIMVYKNNIFYHNISYPQNYDNWTGLSLGTSYTISTHTVNDSAYVNTTFVNLTITTSTDVPKTLVMAGDSITEGIYSNHSGIAGYGGYILDAHPGWTITNQGISGQDIANMTNHYTQQVSQFNPNYTIFENGNSIAHNYSLAQNEAQIMQFEAMSTANNSIMYLNTVPPRTGTYVYNATQNQIRTDLNNWIVCNFTPAHGNRYFFDLNATMTDPSNKSQLFPPYTYDGTHFTDLAYMVWGTNLTTTFPAIDTSGYCAANVIPISSFTTNVTSGTAPLAVQFTDTSTNTPNLWGWFYQNVTGNNTVIQFSTSQNPIQLFGVGNYTIHLNATNTYGSNVTPNNYWINVSEYTPPVPLPVVDFSANNLSFCLHNSTQFTDASQTTITNWAWTFGDGNTSALTNPSHVYDFAGVFDVSLQVTNASGTNSLTKSGYITVLACGNATPPVNAPGYTNGLPNAVPLPIVLFVALIGIILVSLGIFLAPERGGDICAILAPFPLLISSWQFLFVDVIATGSDITHTIYAMYPEAAIMIVIFAISLLNVYRVIMLTRNKNSDEDDE